MSKISKHNSSVDIGEKKVNTIKPISHDGIYPKCVWCGNENYAPVVIDYSKGKANCYECLQYLPPEYIKLEDTKDE